MKTLLSLVLILGGHLAACAQDADQKAVAEVLGTLFKAMELGDSAMARQVFDEPVTNATVYRDKTGSVRIHREDSVESFIKAIGSPHKAVWHEEIWNLKVNVDGDFAQAWCDYAFYLGNTFSHCGVDAVHLYKKDGQWKIFHLADTRKKEGCNIPDSIKSKY